MNRRYANNRKLTENACLKRSEAMFEQFKKSAGQASGFAVVVLPVWVALKYMGVEADAPLYVAFMAFFGASVGSR